MTNNETPENELNNLQNNVQEFLDKYNDKKRIKLHKEENKEKPNKNTLSFNFRHKEDIYPTKESTPRATYITFVEMFYFKHKSLPNKSDFEQVFNDFPQNSDAIQELLLSLQDPLTARGIPAYETPQQFLEPNFVLAVNLITNVLDRRSIPQKLKEADLTTKQWKGFLRQDKYREYYQSCVDDIFNEDAQLAAKLAIMKAIDAGDLQAIKHFHELQNIYRPQNNNNNELVLVMLQVIMEILAAHVSQDVIGKVAMELRSHEQLRALTA